MSTSKPTKQCVQRLQREYKQLTKVVEEREERRRVLHARRLQEDADRQQNPFHYDHHDPTHAHTATASPPSSSSAAAPHAHHTGQQHKANAAAAAAPAVSDELLFTAAPDPDNILRWYFLFESPPQEALYAHGKYLGEFVFPPDYPFKPPKIFLLTPNGRFATGKEICLSNSSYHPESWSPAWSIETVLLGMISFFYSEEHTTGAIDRAGPKGQMVAEKKKCAAASRQYNVEDLKHVYRRVFPEEYARDVAALAEGQQQQHNHHHSHNNPSASGSGERTMGEGAPPLPQQQQQPHEHDQGDNHEHQEDLNHPRNRAVGAAQKAKSPHWSTLVFLLVALVVTVRIVIF